MEIRIEETGSSPQTCVIWMHGLGADAQDMMGLAKELPVNAPVRHIFMNAPVRPVTINNHIPMRAWYDISGVNLTDREDKEGILQSETIIREVMANQVEKGIQKERIFLAGFSQGGAMALFTGLRTQLNLGGVIALSAYLPMASQCEPVLPKQTPIFLAKGLYDSVVLPAWTAQSEQWLRSHNYTSITSYEYPMEHAVCLTEMKDLAAWLNLQISAVTGHNGVHS